MKVNYPNKIDSSPNELKPLLHSHQSLSQVKKIQMLYWLKTGYCQSITEVSRLLGVHRTTVHRWFNQYQYGGLHHLLSQRKKTGRPRIIPGELQKEIKSKLRAEDGGFNSYKSIQIWLEKTYKIKLKYRTLHHHVRYRLQAKLKVPRRCSLKKNPEAENLFKKNLSKILKALQWLESTTKNPAKNGIEYWVQDETRLGLKTLERRKITLKGVKPKGTVQWNFKSYYLYGAIAPKTGASFFWEFSHLDGDCFQKFLDELAKSYPEKLNVIQLDNGRFHYNSKLKIPENIVLIFQPPYCPELNPIERLWQDLKDKLSWSNFENLSSLKEKVTSIIEEFSPEKIISLAGWDYILEALSTVA